jgi:hypothetical protein
MSTPFHNGVRLDSVPEQDAQRTVVLAAGITQAHIGRALTLDGTNANRYRLSGDNDPVDARLLQVEDRGSLGLIGTAAFRFIDELPIAENETVTVGAQVVGAGSGFIKAAAAIGTPADLAAAAAAMNTLRRRKHNLVQEVRTGFAVVSLGF